MNDQDWLARRFEDDRAHLQSVAYRILGSATEADDAIQEAWLRLVRADTSDVTNLRGWLTTVVARVCLDMLRSRKSRREEPLDAYLPEPTRSRDDEVSPEQQAVLADSVGPALLVVLETLTPAERVAFVLHDMFGVPFQEIASILGRTPNATKQLASRARRRVQHPATTPEANRSRQRELVNAFLAASRNGDLNALLNLLDPDVVLRADAAAVQTGAPADVQGAPAVANTFAGRAQAAKLALVDGRPAAVWAPGGQPRVVFRFALSDDRITTIDIVADPTELAQLHVEILRN